MCELREKRLEQEEVYTEFQQGVESLKKENDMLIKKEKLIDKALKDTETDIQTFQTEKQGKLNELHVVVTLQIIMFYVPRTITFLPILATTMMVDVRSFEAVLQQES